MGNEISVQSLGESIRDRVRKTLMDGLPDGAIDKLIQTEFENYFVRKSSYGSAHESSFDKAIRAELDTQIKAMLRSHIASYLQQTYSSESGSMEFIKKHVEELTPVVIAAAQDDLTRNVLNNIMAATQRYS